MSDIPVTPEEMRDYPGIDADRAFGPLSKSRMEFPDCLKGKWTAQMAVNPEAWVLHCGNLWVAEFGPNEQAHAVALAKLLNEAQR